MPGVWSYPDLSELENFVSQLVLQAAEGVSERTIPSAPFVDELSLSRVIIINEWGEGTATFGEDQLDVVLFFEFGGPENIFDELGEAITQEMTNIIDGGDILVPQDLREGAAGIVFTSADIDNFNDILAEMTVSGLDMIFDLTNLQAIDLKTGTPPDQYPRIPLEELIEEEEEVEEEAGVDEETPDITQDVFGEVSALPEAMIPDIREVDVGPEFPEINENLRPFAVDEDTLEIPAGKEEKKIKAREPYDFEREMALPGIVAGTSVSQQTMGEIERPVGRGTLGTEEPVGTYPRTGIYIRNYLKFREPAYIYEIYKNLVFYSGYISTLHNINVRAGTYQSFREYIYVLEEIPERGGPELIEPLTQQEAAGAELEIIPDHPSIEGEKAPWLQRRQYYRLIEANEDHPAWDNAYDYLHGEIEQ